MHILFEIQLVGLLCYFGHGAPTESSPDYPQDEDDPANQYKGRIQTLPQVIVAQINDEVKLPCVVVDMDDDDEAVLWLFKGLAANESKSLFVDKHREFGVGTYSVDEDHTLHIKNFSANLSGVYSCALSVQKTTVVHIVRLRGVAPESAIVYAGEAENSTRICCVFDKPKKLTWLKEGKILPDSDRYYHDVEIHKTCLVIKKVKEEDFGIYTCQSEVSIYEKAEISVIDKTMHNGASYLKTSIIYLILWIVAAIRITYSLGNVVCG